MDWIGLDSTLKAGPKRASCGAYKLPQWAMNGKVSVLMLGRSSLADSSIVYAAYVNESLFQRQSN